MGKRSTGTFKRRKHDLYETPYHAFKPLIPHLRYISYAEPCVGNMALCSHLLRHGYTYNYVSDINPAYLFIKHEDARTVKLPKDTKQVITNPPWTRELLHPIIENLRQQVPTWLLFDADWMHTKQAIPYLQYCSKIVSVGRVKWIPDSKYVGKDNACWYLFEDEKVDTIFVPKS